jgi:hypothetical protein
VQPTASFESANLSPSRPSPPPLRRRASPPPASILPNQAAGDITESSDSCNRGALPESHEEDSVVKIIGTKVDSAENLLETPLKTGNSQMYQVNARSRAAELPHPVKKEGVSSASRSLRFHAPPLGEHDDVLSGEDVKSGEANSDVAGKHVGFANAKVASKNLRRNPNKRASIANAFALKQSTSFVYTADGRENLVSDNYITP